MYCYTNIFRFLFLGPKRIPHGIWVYQWKDHTHTDWAAKPGAPLAWAQLAWTFLRLASMSTAR